MPANTSTFRKYLNPVFVETGSEQGYGIQQAVDAGFEKIYSIELHEKPYLYCLKKFLHNPCVYLIQGDSSLVLGEIINMIPVNITFWLDGHDEDAYPVLAELEAIKNHPIKTHTILIDDLRMFDEKKHGLSIEIIKKKILEINSDYKISFENGHIVNDILVAHI
jgi:hypothetical protein